jgi:acarbose 7IV-phosphotransferase
MQKVLVVGGVSYNSMIYLDRFPQPVPQTVFSKGFHETVGSTGSGKALNLNRLGFDVTLHAPIGHDAPGRAVRDYFQHEHLRFVYDADPGGTERHVNLMDADGDRISIYVHYASADPPVDMARLESLIADCDGLVLNISNYCRRLIPLARQHGKPIWCDIHNYDGRSDYHQDFIAAADYLFLSSDALMDYRPFMEKQMAEGKRSVVCTHGKYGSTALTPDGQWIETPAASYPYKDSNGAGDSFFAGVFYGFAQGYSPQKALQMGAVAGGLCVASSELFDPALSAERLETEYRRNYVAGGGTT